ncbi:hypothetical protein ElyMa_003798800 [Elysia marginata]|uniref:Uncharacterized protein n=1 Tax=Elysia marginata TaxID=1093978 RepID=A0AAV4FDE1_9GAST|nr:hypothetical protein ElyMa_003798800 [Elysia marginata]
MWHQSKEEENESQAGKIAPGTSGWMAVSTPSLLSTSHVLGVCRPCMNPQVSTGIHKIDDIQLVIRLRVKISNEMKFNFGETKSIDEPNSLLNFKVISETALWTIESVLPHCGVRSACEHHTQSHYPDIGPIRLNTKSIMPDTRRISYYDS